MKDLINNLLETHVEIQLGTYFSDCKIIEGDLKFAFSDRIEDFYWNYAYNLNCSLQDLPDKIQLIRNFSKNKERDCTIYVTKETTPKNIAEIINPLEKEEEVWMTISKQSLKLEKEKLRVELLLNKMPNSEFMNIFDNSYSYSEEGSPGYTSLPKEYLECIQNSNPVKGVSSAHFIGYNAKNNPVAVASTFIKNGYAGLYNVGTHHDHRRNGFGIEISKWAINHAFENNCHTVFLQTQADSEVEELYSKVGFERRFIGTFLKV